jgi:hypothetical protein
MFGDMINKETAIIKKANVGISLSGRSLTSVCGLIRVGILAAVLSRQQDACRISGLPDGLCDRGDVRQDGEGGHGSA